MKLTILREILLKPLQLAASIAERRPSLPILANILLQVTPECLTIIGSDSEIELTGMIKLADTENIEVMETGAITVAAKKFVDICRSLPEQSMIELEVMHAAQSNRAMPLESSGGMQQLKISCGRSKFLLATLPADDFPKTQEAPSSGRFSIEQGLLSGLLKQTYFAMAQQDVRHYLNGILLELTDKQLSVVAADGHRLAISRYNLEAQLVESGSHTQTIIPRKAILELLKLLSDINAPVELVFSANQLRVITQDYLLTTKIIDSKFPDYQRIIPKDGNNHIVIDRDIFKQVLLRASILAHEKQRGVRLQLQLDRLHVSAHNPEQEQADEELELSYSGKEMEIAFNVNYLIDILNTVPPGKITLTLTDENSTALLQGVNINTDSLYIVMPLKL